MRRSRGALAVAVLLLAHVAWAGAGAPLVDGLLQKVDLRLQKAAHPTPPLGETACERCHTAQGWTPAVFTHDRTGFHLEGAHERASCASCHHGDFRTPVPTACSACHADAHRGDFGQRCEGCHASETWKPFFTADAHRRTNFPLVGRHALLPCTECHIEMRDRRFTRSTVDCVSCHQADYARTATSAVNHAALGFSTQCRDCHGAWRFQGAKFPAHDDCFLISGGPHATLGCLSCHSNLVGIKVSGTCSTNTAACTNCHEHACARTDGIHTKVPGYQCKDRKCYECHRFSRGP